MRRLTKGEAALRDLRKAASSRAIHREFLEELVAWAEDGADDDLEPNPDETEGLTFDLGVALVLDVRAIFLGDRDIRPLAYPALRAEAAARPRREPKNLWDMMEDRGMH